MTESNPKFYTNADGHAFPVWNPPKTTPEEEVEESTLYDAIILIGAAGMVVIFFIALFWVAAIVEYLLK